MPWDPSRWVDTVFGEAMPGQYDAERLEGICGRDETTLLRLKQVFEKPELLQLYSDDVIERAFWDIWHAAFEAIYHPAIDWQVRYRFIRSFEHLFRDLFAWRCTSALSHLDEGASRLNTTCYMWFDAGCRWFPYDTKTRGPVDAAMLGVIRSILAIDHIACQEAALHGLGHRPTHQRYAVEAIVDDFLGANSKLSPPLRDYALHCRALRVL